MDFQQYQKAFTAHIRDPRNVRRPAGASARRMKVYSELLYNNMEGFLLSCFPVCRKVLGKRRWDRLVREFFRNHVCHTPYFRQIPDEFLQYLQVEWEMPQDFPAFLPELAHYEWIELELDTADHDVVASAHDPAGDLLQNPPVFNPVLRILAYRWPVHQLSPRFRPTEAPTEPTFMLAFRDADWRVRFILINAASARLLSLMQENPAATGGKIVTMMAQEMAVSPGAMLSFAKILLQDLRAQGVFIGTAT